MKWNFLPEGGFARSGWSAWAVDQGRSSLVLALKGLGEASMCVGRFVSLSCAVAIGIVMAKVALEIKVPPKVAAKAPCRACQAKAAAGPVSMAPVADPKASVPAADPKAVVPASAVAEPDKGVTPPLSAEAGEVVGARKVE